MANKSTADVILAIRQHSNTVNRKVVTDDEVLARANEGLWSLYDLIDGAHGTYFVKPFDFTLVGGYGANTSPLPSDFYRAKALDKSPDTSAMRSVPALPSFAERNNPAEIAYDLEDVANIMLVPPPRAAGSYRLRYIPKCPQLGNAIVVKSTNPPPPVTSLIPIPSISTPPVLLTSRLLGSVNNNQADLLVQALGTYLAAGWVMLLSFDGFTIGAPGVNMLTDYTKVRGASGGGALGGSWAVIGNPGNTAQIRFYCTVSSSTTGWNEQSMAVSPAAGFTGGTTTAAPTATDQIVDTDSTHTAWLGTGPVGNPQLYALVWAAPDFSNLRTAWIYGGKLKTLWQYDRLQNSPSGWTKNVSQVVFKWGNTDYTVTGVRWTATQFQSPWGSGGVWKSILTPGPDTVTSCEATMEGVQATTGNLPAIVPIANASSNQFPWTSSPGVIKRGGAASVNGLWGRFKDMWVTITGFNDFDTVGDNYDFIIMGQLIFQWGLGAPAGRLGESGSTNYPTARWQGDR